MKPGLRSKLEINEFDRYMGVINALGLPIAPPEFRLGGFDFLGVRDA